MRKIVVRSLAVLGVVAVPVVSALALQREQTAPADLDLIGGVIQLVQRAYVHPIPSDELTKDALKGLLNRLDPHSDYMDEKEFKDTCGASN